jgi:hypothetical protein
MMRPSLLLLIGLTCAAMTGCAVEGHDHDHDHPHDYDQASLEMTSSTEVEEECKPGFRIGRCPKDFSLPNGNDKMVTLHEHRGSRVAVIGSAMY